VELAARHDGVPRGRQERGRRVLCPTWIAQTELRHLQGMRYKLFRRNVNQPDRRANTHRHTHTHTYICIHTHTHTHIHTYTHTYIYAHIHTHIHSYTHTHTHRSYSCSMFGTPSLVYYFLLECEYDCRWVSFTAFQVACAACPCSLPRNTSLLLAKEYIPLGIVLKGGTHMLPGMLCRAALQRTLLHYTTLNIGHWALVWPVPFLLDMSV